MRWPETCSKILQQLLALAEAVEEDGERADVHGVRAQPDQVRLDARQLVEQHAQVLRARRNLQLQQLFDRQAVAEIVGHAGRDSRCGRSAARPADRTSPRRSSRCRCAGSRYRAPRAARSRRRSRAPGAARRGSTGAAGPCSGPWCGRARPLRDAARAAARWRSRLRRASPASARSDCEPQLAWRLVVSATGFRVLLPSAVALHRIVLAQGMALPFVGHHDAAQVGMSAEADAEEVEDLALVEVRRRPDGRDAVDLRGRCSRPARPGERAPSGCARGCDR